MHMSIPVKRMRDRGARANVDLLHFELQGQLRLVPTWRGGMAQKAVAFDDGRPNAPTRTQVENPEGHSPYLRSFPVPFAQTAHKASVAVG
jgi:hypothetical protein